MHFDLLLKKLICVLCKKTSICIDTHESEVDAANHIGYVGFLVYNNMSPLVMLALSKIWSMRYMYYICSLLLSCYQNSIPTIRGTLQKIHNVDTGCSMYYIIFRLHSVHFSWEVKNKCQWLTINDFPRSEVSVCILPSDCQFVLVKKLECVGCDITHHSVVFHYVTILKDLNIILMYKNYTAQHS